MYLKSVVRWPGGKNSTGAFSMECVECEYPGSGVITDVKGNVIDWTKTNYVGFAGVGGYLSKIIFEKDDTLTITELSSNNLRQVINRNENKKITKWTAEATYAEYGSDNETFTKKEVDVTNKFSFTRNSDGTWTVKMTGTVPGGSHILFQPVFASCNHSGGTRLSGKRSPICDQPGYTGDKICKDCGKLVEEGKTTDPIGDSHTGTLTLIPGTKITGNCYTHGYSGDFRCSACGLRMPGKKTGYDHSAYSETTADAMAATCTTDGYTGDKYCSHCGALTGRGKTIPAYHASTKLVNQKAATETEKGYSGDTWCNICNSIVEYGHDLPMIQKPKLEEFRITLPLPKDGDTGESKPHTMYTGSTVPSGGAGVPASAWYKWDAGLAKWTQFTETFRTGELYKAALNIYPSTSVKVTDQTKIYVNGELQAKTPNYILGKNMWHVEYQFRVTDEGGLPKVLKSFDAVIPRPLVGDSIMDIKVTDNTEGLEIYNAGWYIGETKQTDGTFQSGKTYEYRYSIRPKEGYQFPTGSTISHAGNVNGHINNAYKDSVTGQYVVKTSFVPCYPNLSETEVAGIKNKTYTGKPITQDLTLTWDGHTLKEGVHYTATYTDNVKVGTAKIRIVANLGTKDLTFKINYRKGWNEDATGWCYKRADGTWIKSKWEKIKGHWYHFDKDGYMATGWKKLGGKWYYFGNNGVMRTGWVKYNGAWYYMDSEGVMQTGWIKVDGKDYCLRPDGTMVADEWYKGWYLNPDGTCTWPYKGSWKKSSKGWWFGDTSGWYAKNETLRIDGKSYTFDAKGYLKE